MKTVQLKATVRSDQGKGPARQLRMAGKLPTVAYGKGSETLSLAVASDDLRTILTSERGRNSIITLEVPERESFPVMVKEYKVHPVSRVLLHADFVRVDFDKPIDCEIPFRSTGKSKGEAAGGTLLANTRTLRVRCLPASIPTHLEHDVSELQIDDVVKVSDLTLPKGLEVLLPEERKLLVVTPPRVAEEADEDETAEAGAAEGAEAKEGEEASK